MMGFTKKHIVLSAFAAILALSLTACSASGESAAPPKQDATPAPTPTPTPTPTPSTSPTPVPTPPPTSSTGNNGATAPPKGPSQQDEALAYVKQIMEQAKKGKVPGSDFAAHTSLIDDVEKSWGKADTTESAGKGIYSTYDNHKAAFGFNKGSKIFDVRSYDAKLHSLSLSEIKSVLGNPSDTIPNKTETIYVYKAGEQFELKFIIPESSGKVDHISVFSPKDSINNMAG
ncbi:DUF4309 domain-containing protein [Paenibacillus sp. H1-7]|uniref:YjgB family protein n=1 Tax=Paenibacillus sp. H1-7 TaxID=2282849 RepID=UPI001EF7C143|nr:YjgB family protein [Paenibacillus sp. H1-7]ULL16110.1 DUF4309 domain-containing protein [Paenibacillus sp. H1-7]